MSDKKAVPDLNFPEHYLNREISHLKFHTRVLAQATNPKIPLLERLRFLLIFSNNLDEFFEIRIAGLKQKVRYEHYVISKDGLTPQMTLHKLHDLCHKAVDEQYKILNETLIPELAKEDIRFLRRAEWTEEQSDWAREYFKEQILPVMSPIGLDPAHPFPRIANKSLNFIVSLSGKDAFSRQSGLAIVPAPRPLQRLIKVPTEISSAGAHYIFLSSVIHNNADLLFPGMSVQGCYQFRVTRNSDLNFDEELVEDLAIALRGELFSRRYGDEVRLEIADNCPTSISDFLLNQFNLSEAELYRVNGMVNLARIMSVTDLDLPALKYPGFRPGVPKRLRTNENIFENIRKKDALLHHPYESFRPVIDFLRQASQDPKVLAIKQTLYRTGPNAEIMDLLVEAARNGKEVTAVVELRARFDEESNLAVASRLQDAGAIVAYGIVGYKTHSKMILVVRQEDNKLRRYVHLGTGNYHAGNAKIYTDFSFFTCDEDICEDVHKIFQQLTGMGRAAKLKQILYSPFTLHNRMTMLMEKERQNALDGKDARIMVKVNGLTEAKAIQSLYHCSQAGVKIDLIIRGICCLKPGIKGLSDNIRVKSIVGRFLEHTRVIYFHNGGEPLVFLSSADWMERNFFNRVETCFPIKSKSLRDRVINESFSTYIEDNVDGWILSQDGEYQPTCPEENEVVSRAQNQLLDQLGDK